MSQGNEEEKRALETVEKIAQLNESLRAMGTQRAIEYLALEVMKHRSVLEQEFVTVHQMRDVLKLIAGTITASNASLRKRVAKMESGDGSRGAGVNLKADNVTVDGMDQVAAMMERLDATLRSPTKPIYDKDGVLVGARREALPGDTSNAALEARIAAIEAQSVPKYLGVWQREKSYDAGACVTHGGSVWHAKEKANPGDAPNLSRCWVLMVKRGRDGRDAG
jgi:hypothetical protein